VIKKEEVYVIHILSVPRLDPSYSSMRANFPPWAACLYFSHRLFRKLPDAFGSDSKFFCYFRNTLVVFFLIETEQHTDNFLFSRLQEQPPRIAADLRELKLFYTFDHIRSCSHRQYRVMQIAHPHIRHRRDYHPMTHRHTRTRRISANRSRSISTRAINLALRRHSPCSKKNFSSAKYMSLFSCITEPGSNKSIISSGKRLIA